MQKRCKITLFYPIWGWNVAPKAPKRRARSIANHKGHLQPQRPIRKQKGPPDAKVGRPVGGRLGGWASSARRTEV